MNLGQSKRAHGGDARGVDIKGKHIFVLISVLLNSSYLSSHALAERF